MSILPKTALWSVRVTLAVAGIWLAYALKDRPILVHSPGDWNCACGVMYIKTTIHSIWNPFRDRKPEIVAEEFLSKLRANDCAVAAEVCQAALPSHRVSEWKLSFREDDGSTATLYYRLTKYGSESKVSLTGVGAVGVLKTPAGWSVIAFDSYF